MKLLSVAIPIICLMLFSGATDTEFKNDHDYKQELNNILTVRTEALSQAYFSGKDCSPILETVLADPVLKNDINGVKENFCTDFEIVSGFEIADCEVIAENEREVILRTVIFWEMGAMDGNIDRNKGEYTIVLTKVKEYRLKMSEFIPES